MAYTRARPKCRHFWRIRAESRSAIARRNDVPAPLSGRKKTNSRTIVHGSGESRLLQGGHARRCHRDVWRAAPRLFRECSGPAAFPASGSRRPRAVRLSLSDTGLLTTIFTLNLAVAELPTGYLLARFFPQDGAAHRRSKFFPHGETALTVPPQRSISGHTDLSRRDAASAKRCNWTVMIAIAAKLFGRLPARPRSDR